MEKVVYSEDLAVIGIIGEGLAVSFSHVLEILNAVGKEGINIENINCGGSPISAVLVIRDEDYVKAMNVIASVIA